MEWKLHFVEELPPLPPWWSLRWLENLPSQDLIFKFVASCVHCCLFLQGPLVTSPWHSLLCAPGQSLLAGCTPPRAVPQGLSTHRATKDAAARGLGKRIHQKNPTGVLLPSYLRGGVQTLEHPHRDFHQGTIHSAPCTQVPSWCLPCPAWRRWAEWAEV